MRKPLSFVWSLGQTRGYLASITVPKAHPSVSRADHRGNHHLVVTTDSVNWAYRIVPAYSTGRQEGSSTYFNAINPRTLIQEGATVHRANGVGTMDSGIRLAIEWGKKQAKRDLDTGADLEVTHTTPAAREMTVTSYPTIFDGDVVSYIGKVQRSAHTLESLHRVVVRAQEDALRVWGFSCSRLIVSFFDAGSAVGLAYNPGSGKSTGVRRIALKNKLMQAYTLDTIWRTVIHELCHHAREELSPRSNLARDPHDTLFCDMLGRVDLLSNDARTCTFFTSQMDPSLAAGIMQRKVGSVPPVYDPALGEVYIKRLKTGELRIGWMPTERAVARWKLTLSPLTGQVMVDLLKRFTPGQWGGVTVTTVGFNQQPRPTDLAGWTKHLIALSAKQMMPVVNYLNTLEAV